MTDTRAPLEAPEGTRDLLFEDARRLRSCEAAVGRVFGEAGYAEVVPPVIERSELFAEVASLRATDSTGRSLSLRADFTDQIARIAATRIKGTTPLKLWYRGPVVRDVAPGRIAPRERFQIGLELIGDASPNADVEVLSLAASAIEAVGIAADDVRISVGSTTYFAAVLAVAGTAPAIQAQLRDCIDRKDRAGTARLASSVADANARDALLFLASAEPQTQALSTARSLAPDEAAARAIDRLQAIVEAARARLGDRLEVDLGEVRGLGYYTGLVFNVYASGAPGPIGGGGRYDRLLARFGDERPAVGFSLDLDALAPLARSEGGR